jgi:PPOX class probable F420-dependent enzyme
VRIQLHRILLGFGSGQEVARSGQNLTRVLTELPKWAADLLEDVPVAHLGLLDPDGRPRVLPVTFARFGDALWSAVDDKPKGRPGERLARVRWLRERPAAALTVDRYDDDWTRLAWVQVLGDVEILETRSHEEALEALAARYPAYREREPGGPLLKLRPKRLLWWRASG